MTLDWEKIARHQMHPIRQGVLDLMMDGKPRSPLELSVHFGLPLNKLGYHVAALRDAGVISLLRIEPVRGALRHVYVIADDVQIEEVLAA